MSKPIPQIYKFMTANPYSIDSQQTVEKAHIMMKEHKIRHLPVFENDKLVGLISERDLLLYETLIGTHPKQDTVGRIIDREVYTVQASTPLDKVSEHMAEIKVGSAVVMDNQKVVGIFTSIDAMRALSDLLHTRLAKA